MKVIPVNRITGVSASSEDPNYPAENLLDSRPKKVWKALSAGSQVLIFTMVGKTSGLAIFNTNATAVSFVLSDPNKVVLASTTVLGPGAQLADISPGVTAVVNLDGSVGSVLVEWGEINAPLTLEATLVNNSNDILFAGIADGGEVYSSPNPELGMSEDEDDLSIADEYDNGGIYFKDGDTLRIFGIDAVMERDTEFHNFIFSVSKIVKKNPRPWMITDLDNPRWLVYARFTKKPKARHSEATRSSVTFELKEYF